MSAYPTGTVTFLFTHVEDSTRLLREAFGTARGREVDTQGDTFFHSFARARDAVLAGLTALGPTVASVTLAALVGIGFLFEVASF